MRRRGSECQGRKKGSQDPGRVEALEALTSEVATIGALLVVKHPLVIFHQAAQLLRQLQSQVLLGSGLGAVHHHCLSWLVQGGLMGMSQRKGHDTDLTDPWTSNLP